MAYLLDSNVFIQAKNLHYGFDFCPAFWEWIDQAHATGTAFSIEKVREELLAGSDELAIWARDRDNAFFLPPNDSTVASLAAVSSWAGSGDFEPSAVSVFLQGADYYLVAQAHAEQFVVVTHETPGTSPRRIKIPNACLAHQVRTVSLYDMLRAEQARFVLAR
ncbi:MAG: DUF4411 family protein [Solirubrobacteraceae bacterium]